MSLSAPLFAAMLCAFGTAFGVLAFASGQNSTSEIEMASTNVDETRHRVQAASQHAQLAKDAVEHREWRNRKRRRNMPLPPPQAVCRRRRHRWIMDVGLAWGGGHCLWLANVVNA